MNIKQMQVIDLKEHVRNLTDTREAIVASNLTEIMEELEGKDYMDHLDRVMPKLGKSQRIGVFGEETIYTYEGTVILVDPVNLRQPIQWIIFYDRVGTGNGEGSSEGGPSRSN